MNWMIADFDVCHCGDYRHQHVNGTGQCKLGWLCTPGRCQKFRLSREATEIPAPYSTLNRSQRRIIQDKDNDL